jgi:hypothetical protein
MRKSHQVIIEIEALNHPIIINTALHIYPDLNSLNNVHERRLLSTGTVVTMTGVPLLATSNPVLYDSGVPKFDFPP